MGRPGLIERACKGHAKVPNLKKRKPLNISVQLLHSTLNDVLSCSVYTSDSDQDTDWTTESLWFISRQQAESLPFEVSPDPIKGYSGRSVKLNTHLFQLPMLRNSAASYVLTVPTQQVPPLSFLPEHGDTFSLRNAVQF